MNCSCGNYKPRSTTGAAMFNHGPVVVTVCASCGRYPPITVGVSFKESEEFKSLGQQLAEAQASAKKANAQYMQARDKMLTARYEHQRRERGWKIQLGNVLGTEVTGVSEGIQALAAQNTRLRGTLVYLDSHLNKTPFSTICQGSGLHMKIIEALDNPPTQHPDDIAVDHTATAMKAKLAKKRAQGYSGWDDANIPVQHLAKCLVDHIAKGDPIDAANFAMMLHNRNAKPEALANALAEAQPVDGYAVIIGDEVHAGIFDDEIIIRKNAMLILFPTMDELRRAHDTRVIRLTEVKPQEDQA